MKLMSLQNLVLEKLWVAEIKNAKSFLEMEVKDKGYLRFPGLAPWWKSWGLASWSSAYWLPSMWSVVSFECRSVEGLTLETSTSSSFYVGNLSVIDWCDTKFSYLKQLQNTRPLLSVNLMPKLLKNKSGNKRLYCCSKKWPAILKFRPPFCGEIALRDERHISGENGLIYPRGAFPPTHVNLKFLHLKFPNFFLCRASCKLHTCSTT